MKLFEYIKDENVRTTKFCGLTVMKQTSDYMTTERHQEFLGGLVSTTKISSNGFDSSKKEIKILGKSLIKRNEKDNIRSYSIFGKDCCKVSLIKRFEKNYLKYFNKKHDDIYILRANSGEIYLTLTYIIDTLIRKNQSKNPLLVATKKYHVDMIKMICPEIPYIYLGKLRLQIVGNSFNIGKFRFFLLYDLTHFKQVEMDIRANEVGKHHYFKSILNRFNLDLNEVGMRKAQVLPNAEKSMLEKIGAINLNIDKFVFLAPEAQSCKLYDEDFWILLITTLQAKGYDVFVNLVENSVKLTNALGYKTCNLTFAEAFALAKRAKKIVSLRSGLSEFLLQTNTPMDILYTKFRHRHLFDDMDSYHVVSGFGLSQLPFVDRSKIKEFNMFEVSPSECLKCIVETL